MRILLFHAILLIYINSDIGLFKYKV